MLLVTPELPLWGVGGLSSYNVYFIDNKYTGTTKIIIFVWYFKKGLKWKTNNFSN